MIGSVLNGIGNIISFSLKTGAVILISAGAFTALTKPEEKSFKPFFETFMKEKLNKDTIQSEFAADIVSKGINLLTAKESKDYVFLRTIKVKNPIDDKNDMYFVGIAQNWFQCK